MNKYIVDIHSHVLFGVDDGAKDFMTSRQLISDAYKQGVRKMVATPHRNLGKLSAAREKIEENFRVLKEFTDLSYRDFELCLGSEVYCSPAMAQDMAQDDFFCIGSSDYLLVEFADRVKYRDIVASVKNVFLCGRIPIIAHAERYDTLAFDRDKTEELLSMGAVIQLDADSVLKGSLFHRDKYKKRSKFFIKKDYAHCVASDVHNMESRRSHIREAYGYVAEKYGYEKAERLFCTNPENILKNRVI